MLSVALYARYSSDNQRDASIEDQLRLCRERADREGWRIVGSYSDRSISGASLIRPGIQALMADAQDRRFDIVLAESLDRISGVARNNNSQSRPDHCSLTERDLGIHLTQKYGILLDLLSY